MISKYLISIYCCIFLLSCSRNEEINYLIDSFGEFKELSSSSKYVKGENLKIDEIFGRVSNIHFYENKLIFKDELSNMAVGYINLDEMKTHNLLKKGEGPNEIANTEFVKINNIDENGILQLYQYSKNTLFYVDIEKSVVENLSDQIPEHFILSQQIYKVKDSCFLFASPELNGSFSILNKGVEYNISVPTYASPDRALSSLEKNIISPKNIGFNKTLDYIFTYRLPFNSIEIYTSEGQYLKSYIFGQNKNYVDHQFHKKYAYYYEANSHKDYLYGLYGGFSQFDNFTEKIIPFLKSELHLYNLKTDQLTIFKLDRLLNSCTIDFTSMTCYCVEENNEKYPFVKYKLDI